jgi:hypothetical protein
MGFAKHRIVRMTEMRMRAVVAMAVSATALLGSAPAHAEGWDVRVSPYLWASGLDGTASVLPALPTAEVNDNFGDVLKKLDIALMGAVEAENGKFYVRSDIFYASLTAKGETPLNLYSGAKLQSKSFNMSGALGYVVHEDSKNQLNLFAGARIWDLSNEATFLAGSLPESSFKAGRTFVDPIVGASGQVAISENVSAALTGSVGGFGAGAKIEHGAAATVNVDLGKSWGMAAGYRYLYVDFEKNDFVYKMTQHGPVVGAYFNF